MSSDIIDVEFIDLTAQENRRRRIRNAFSVTMVTLMALAGLLFFPMLILWLTGEDITVNMAESLGEGHYLFTAFHLTLDLLTALIAGFIGIALFPRQD
jgi:hypothetical protein